MTAILPEHYGIRTKKGLKEYVEADVAETLVLIDPKPWGEDAVGVRHLEEGDSIVVTNHPQRSWFASITRRNGKLEVK